MTKKEEKNYYPMFGILMTDEEVKHITDFFGRSIDEIDPLDIPAYIRRRSDQQYSEDYPLGGMIEPYDIEREKELLKN